MRESMLQKDIRVLRRSQVIEALVNEDDMRFDSVDDASVFFARELDYIKSKSYDKKYPEFTALQNFPVTSEVNAGAETITYYSYEKTGFAKIINNYATDLPRADVKGRPTTSPIKSLGDSYGYSVQEMRASRMAGKSLDIRKAEAARYQIDRLTNKIAWAGDSEYGLLGILSEGTNIPEYTIPQNGKQTSDNDTTLWKYKTADQILDDINGMVNYQRKLTKGVENPDTLLLPTDVYGDIATRRIPNSDSTVLAYVLKNSPWLKTVKDASELLAESTETNTSGSSAAILYKKDSEKFSVEIPMMFYQYPLQPTKLEIEVPCEARVAGCIFYYPLSILIAYGV
jgi:hypothetical protein